MHTMSDQELFDTSVSATLAQGRKSMNKAGTCQYRGSNGLKSTIGHLIPDSRYKPIMEEMWAPQILFDLEISDNMLLSMKNEVNI